MESGYRELRSMSERTVEHPKSEYSEAAFATEAEALNSPLTRLTSEAHEAVTSGHMVRMIDFFFALVLAQGILRFDDAIQAPWHSNPPVLLALVAIYYTVIRSFVGWHAAIEERRYRLFVAKVRTTELWRVYIDVAIVVVYAYLLINAEPLQEDAGNDITALLWGFPVLFLLYGLWGHFRRIAWGKDGFSLPVLGCFGSAYIVLATLYCTDPFDFGGSASLANSLALGAALALMVAYRFINFWQGHDDAKRWHRVPVPRIPRLTSLD